MTDPADVIREDDATEKIARALRASREFLNGLPLNDGASRRAIDREFIAVKLVPEALAALEDMINENRRYREALGDMRDHGLRCDLNPTRYVNPESTPWKRADDFWWQYLIRADERIRIRARVALAAPDTPEGREGIVTVYDHEGRYLGCMGIETWRAALATPDTPTEGGDVT
jgi:hypothetical protein